jgi:dTDP-4-dehydrorhamnose 3,5-epimerase
MKVTPLAIPDVLLVAPAAHRDVRGYFLESYHEGRYRAAGIDAAFVQDNQSQSTRGTLRGLHWQIAPRAQAKLVRVLFGEIFDVAVDIRPGSPRFGRWVGATLSGDNFLQMYVPIGFAHGFCVTSEVADVAYKCSDFYDPSLERGLAWNDPAVAIDWPIVDPVLSARDQRHPSLDEIARWPTG